MAGQGTLQEAPETPAYTTAAGRQRSTFDPAWRKAVLARHPRCHSASFCRFHTLWALNAKNSAQEKIPITAKRAQKYVYHKTLIICNDCFEQVTITASDIIKGTQEVFSTVYSLHSINSTAAYFAGSAVQLHAD